MSQRLYAVLVGEEMLHTTPSSDDAFRMFDILRQTVLPDVSVAVLHPTYVDICDEPTRILTGYGEDEDWFSDTADYYWEDTTDDADTQDLSCPPTEDVTFPPYEPTVSCRHPM